VNAVNTGPPAPATGADGHGPPAVTTVAAAPLSAPLSGVLTRGPLLVAPATPVADVALAMREGRHSCAVVTSDPAGIVTNGDLQARVLAERRSPDTPAGEVMTRPVHVLPAEAPLLRVLMLMLDEQIEHVPVVQGRRIIGVVTDVDVIRRQSASPLLVADRIRRAGSADDLGGYAHDVAAAVAALHEDGVDPLRTAAVVTSLSDALTVRPLHLAEQKLGPPPGPYAWLALGSQGRAEELPHSDQDTALAHTERDAEAAGYFAVLATVVTDGLATAGIPPCGGGFMATGWCRPLPEWRATFRRWIDAPDAEALFEAQVFLDFRVVHGELDTAVLDEVLARGRDRPGFLAALAQAATRIRPRLGPFGRIRANLDGIVDVKMRGTVPVAPCSVGCTGSPPARPNGPRRAGCGRPSARPCCPPTPRTCSSTPTGRCSAPPVQPAR
jgi:CBS domain-containing protein